VLYGPDVFAKGDRLLFADDITHVVLPRVVSGEVEVDWEREREFFAVVYGNDWWTVYERIR